MRYANGVIAGFVATIVLSAIMLMKSAMGLMPQLNVIQMLTEMGTNYGGLPASPVIGWIMHLFIGSILWGLIFAATAPMWPGSSYLARGASFSVSAWLLMMIVAMPMAGAGFFGMALGIMAPIATLVLHVIYGLVLGAVFGRLESRTVHSAHARR
ncbi:DUF6789 family protein [Aurantimonas sp. E1-2-R+4]|uniref:DUF6789 family protein n=1 Tax=Aurantimonas sp. E1-2-R+4 TaxID=3113714 RepID=UPI002F92CEB7